ncbi:MAG TPA: hypothetical protein VN695_11655 [Streptosporangiaceae bacterium]|nr:hypothetical protein [Streptosporangiaceae bacterium]
MSDRDDRYVGNDAPSLPRNTGEFRATPDVSASTAEFKAFAARQNDGIGRSTDSGSWPAQPWPGEAPSSGSSRTPVLLIGGAILLAVIVLVLILAFA